MLLACLNEVQEELLHYLWCRCGVGISKMLKFLHLSFSWQGADRRAILSSDRSCFLNIFGIWKKELSCISYEDQGPVVQNITSLISSLRGRLFKCSTI